MSGNPPTADKVDLVSRAVSARRLGIGLVASGVISAVIMATAWVDFGVGSASGMTEPWWNAILAVVVFTGLLGGIWLLVVPDKRDTDNKPRNVSRSTSRWGLGLVAGGLATAGILATLWFGNGADALEQAVLGLISLGSFLCGIWFLVIPVRPVTIRAVTAWSTPGILTICWTVPLLVLPIREEDIVGNAIPILLFTLGIISPATSIGATILAIRSRALPHAVLCIESWTGALLFWSSVAGALRWQE